MLKNNKLNIMINNIALHVFSLFKAIVITSQDQLV